MAERPNDGDQIKAPSNFPWPPILLVALLGASVALSRIVPLSVSGFQIPALGWGLVVLALAVDVWVFVLFSRHKTNIRPDRAASAIVTSGPFSFSRNPIYVGNALILLGGVFITGSLWFGGASILFIVLVTELAIKPEERHMAARFGDGWDAYAAHVRRWL